MGGCAATAYRAVAEGALHRRLAVRDVRCRPLVQRHRDGILNSSSGRFLEPDLVRAERLDSVKNRYEDTNPNHVIC